MAELSGQASGPRSPHTRYPRVIDSERGLYRQVFCRDKVIDNSGHVVFSSWSHFFGVIEEMSIYSNGTKTGTLHLIFRHGPILSFSERAGAISGILNPIQKALSSEHQA